MVWRCFAPSRMSFVTKTGGRIPPSSTSWLFAKATTSLPSPTVQPAGARQDQNLTYRAAIHGTEAGITFDVVAEPETDFLTNRCGFCILHPIVNLAGTPVTVEHTDGEMEQSALPDLIEPWQPFKDMRAISHHVGPGLIASCRMEGGVWEMEDQRNWSDASYKTYVRPLALPWPYVMPRAVTDRQTVTLTIEDRRQQRPAASSTLRQESVDDLP